MKKINKILSSIILLIGICIISSISCAATEEYSVKMQSDKTEYKIGETVDIIISIEDIKNDEGIAAFSTILNYDESIFEDLNVKEIDEWDTPMLIENMIQSTRKDMVNSKENQKVAIVSLKVKEDATSTKTTISLTKFDATDGNTTMRNDDGASIDLKIEGKKDLKSEASQNSYMIYIIVAIVLLVAVAGVIIFKKKKR